MDVLLTYRITNLASFLLFDLFSMGTMPLALLLPVWLLGFSELACHPTRQGIRDVGNTMSPSGIEPVTFRLLVQYVNQMRRHVHNF